MYSMYFVLLWSDFVLVSIISFTEAHKCVQIGEKVRKAPNQGLWSKHMLGASFDFGKVETKNYYL